MEYSVDDYKNLAPSQIVVGNAEDYLTMYSTGLLTVNFKDNGSISPNVLYILSFRYHTTETVTASENFIQVDYTFGKNNARFSGKMIIADATLMTIDPRYVWFSASNSYLSGTNTTQLLVTKNLYSSYRGRANEPTYSGLLFLRLF